MIILDSTPRECGDLKEDSYYGGGELVPGGILEAVSWLLGPMWDVDLGGGETGVGMMEVGGMVPPRTQVEINPTESIYRSGLWLREWGTYDRDYTVHAGDFGLADHIGSSYYTPWSYADETKSRGANRKVTDKNARKWAEEVPFVVFCTHSDIPFFRDQVHAERFLSWAQGNRLTDISEQVGASELLENEVEYCHSCSIEMPAGVTRIDDLTGNHSCAKCGSGHIERRNASKAFSHAQWDERLREELPALDWSHTWERERFGLYFGTDHGHSHPGRNVLQALHNAGEQKIAIPEDVAPVEYRECAYMATWWSYVAYTGTLSEEDDEAGIEEAIIE